MNTLTIIVQPLHMQRQIYAAQRNTTTVLSYATLPKDLIAQVEHQLDSKLCCQHSEPILVLYALLQRLLTNAGKCNY